MVLNKFLSPFFLVFSVILKCESDSLSGKTKKPADWHVQKIIKIQREADRERERERDGKRKMQINLNATERRF